MSEFTNTDHSFPSPVTGLTHGESLAQTLEAYWNEVRGAGRLPVRSAIDPTRIDAALPHSFVIERVAPGIGRLRVCGQQINAILGMEGRGMPLSVLFNPEGRVILADYVEQVFAGPCVVKLPLMSARSLTRPRLTGQLLLLPLEGDGGLTTRAMGAIFVEGAPRVGPRTFDIPPSGHRCDRVGSPFVAVSTGLPNGRGPTSGRPALRLVSSRP